MSDISQYEVSLAVVCLRFLCVGCQAEDPADLGVHAPSNPKQGGCQSLQCDLPCGTVNDGRVRVYLALLHSIWHTALYITYAHGLGTHGGVPQDCGCQFRMHKYSLSLSELSTCILPYSLTGMARRNGAIGSSFWVLTDSLIKRGIDRRASAWTLPVYTSYFYH